MPPQPERPEELLFDHLPYYAVHQMDQQLALPRATILLGATEVWQYAYDAPFKVISVTMQCRRTSQPSNVVCALKLHLASIAVHQAA
jgi:hypothetical protein